MGRKETLSGEKVHYKIGVDIGGTFTDIVLLGTDGSIETKKVSSTPDDYSRGIATGVQGMLSELDLSPDQMTGIVHASTVGANTILEYKGAWTGLITTQGFRDVLEMRRLRIPKLYDLQYEKPVPLVPRHLRFEISERLGPRGDIWKGLSLDEVEQTALRLKEAGAEAVAICFLHSYANPEHEERAADIVHRVLGDNVYITRSSEILPEIREYERTSTTVVNAYIGPVVKRYMKSLISRFDEIGLSCAVQIMHSGGGLMTIDAVTRKPACTIDSGPAAGVIACAHLAKKLNHGNLISFDMGGTTAKAGMIENGQPAKTAEYEVGAGVNLSSKLVKGGGYPVKLPFIDLSEIGAGGGSLVSIDSLGHITVGPKSAGAVPGPVCYDLGNKHPTFTDALVTLGYINPEFLAGGEVRLNADKARQALEEKVARPLGKPLLEAAHGVLMLGCATMTRAVKAVSTYRGRDPRDFLLVAFGGNGPVVAAEIARSLQMKRVVIPPAPGVFSAVGLLFSDVEYEFIRTFFRRGEETTPEMLWQAYGRLEEEAREAMKAEGYPLNRVVLVRSADLRYSGQAYELTIPVSGGVPDFSQMTRAFGDEHERTYGHRSDTDPVDLVNIKVIAKVAAEEIAVDKLTRRGSQENARATQRPAYFGPKEGIRQTPVLHRAELKGRSLKGPLIIEEYDATCVVPPWSRVTLDALGNIDMTVEEE
jgi:N-methylhydantoinase A